MKILTKEILKKLPPLYANAEKESSEVKVPLKLFFPAGRWTWYATKYDPESKTCFGFVVGEGEELGYFSLEELEGIRYRGLRVERDLHWDGNTTLEQVMNGERR